MESFLDDYIILLRATGKCNTEFRLLTAATNALSNHIKLNLYTKGFSSGSYSWFTYQHQMCRFQIAGRRLELTVNEELGKA
jgi:hypothetical protein